MTTYFNKDVPPEPELATADDAEWVAELIDTMREGDTDVTLAILEGLVRRLRKASKARGALTRVPAQVLREAMELRRGPAGGTP